MTHELSPELEAEATRASEKTECTHEWKKHEEPIAVAERTEKQLIQGMAFKGSKAYFVVKECVNCKEKRRLDYKVEGVI